MIRRKRSWFLILVYLTVIIVTCWQCIPGINRQFTHDIPADPGMVSGNDQQYLKVHMKDGSLYALTRWFTVDSSNLLNGTGDHYDLNRVKIASSGDSLFKIRYPDVALFESNKVTGLGGKIAGHTLIAAPFMLISIICMTNPKACFGSCPTFYAWDGNKMRLMAEGFSSSIAKVFEETDIDMLNGAVTNRKDFRLDLTNEALETHAIRFADLMVIPKKNGERVFASPEGKFYRTSTVITPFSCLGSEGDCTKKIAAMDQVERFSTADSSDLTAKETLEVTFRNVPSGNTGLIIGSRQTLMTTFLFYQGMAHAGSKLPYCMAEVEKGNVTMQKHMTRLWDLLGGIEIYVRQSNGKWEKAGQVDEMGPIAADLRIVPLPSIQGKNLDVKLKMTRGLYRMDQVALVNIIDEVLPVRIKPSLVIKEMQEDETARQLLNDTSEYLVTFPGERYELHYNLPDSAQTYEVFLCSRGYYLEWMRDQWIKEENMLMLALMFSAPHYYLRMMAPKFKEAEPLMEESFWNSRYVTN